MKKISELVTLNNQIEVISMGELRSKPGEVIESVKLGKTFIVAKSGIPIGVLSPLPGNSLTMNIDSKGNKTYSL